jgi:crotonobetaine/carnitine-CoA ligase
MYNTPAQQGMHAAQAGDFPRTVPGLFKHAVDTFGQRPCLQVVGGIEQTYAELWHSVLLLAGKLKSAGIIPNDYVILMLGNNHHAIHAWLAVNLLNAVDVSINTAYKGQSLEHAINVTNGTTVVTTSEFVGTLLRTATNTPSLRRIIVLDRLPEEMNSSHTDVSLLDVNDMEQETLVQPAPTNPWDIGSVIFTSGTSGPAKGVLMPHAQITLLASLAARKTALQEGDIFFSFYPMYHMAGKFMSVLASFSVGAKLVLDSGFDPSQWLDRIRNYQATVTAAHGPMLEMVYAQPASPSDKDHKLRLIRTAPFPKRIAAEFEQRFSVRGMEVWGMTEIGVVCWNDPAEPLRVGSCGRPDDSWYDFAVVDPVTDEPLPAGNVGEFVVRPKAPWITTPGYIGMPERTLEAFRNLWFHTGDSGYIDAEGYVYFVDRTKERIRRRAENISAADIEAATLLHPAVLEAAAAGVPSGLEGDDDIMLCIVTKSGVALDPVELLTFLLNELPHFMVPRYVHQALSLPRTPTGKLQRSALQRFLGHENTWDRKAAKIALRDLAR